MASSKALGLVLLVAVGAGAAAFMWRPPAKVATELTFGAVGRIEAFRPDSTLCLNIDGGCQTVDQPREFFMRNYLQTGETGMIDAVLMDGTRLIIASESSFVIDEFVFDPEQAGKLKASIGYGAMRMVTGQMGALEQKTVTIETPVASLGVRGTDFWVGEIDGAFSVLVLDGIVEVSTDVGSVVLDEPGEGVGLPARDQAPGPVRVWPEEKRARALARVTF